jgi:hypothetical protein
MSELYDAARAAEILRARWEQDPLRRVTPSPRQQLALESAKSEVAMLGANRSGKSEWLAMLVASLARFGNPNPGTAYSHNGRLAITDRAVSIWVIGLTEKLVREGIQGKIITTAYSAAETHPAFIPPSEIDSWNINDQTWRLKNGSIIGFKTADAGRDVFQSAGRDLVAFDEICDREVYKEATFRAPGGGRRLLIRLAATLLPPLGMAGGISWYFQEKLKPWWAAGNKENRTGNPHPFLDVFSMGIRDNPHIAREEIERLEDMFALGSFEARIRLDGELLATIGGTKAYPSFNSAIHVDPMVTPDRIDHRAALRLCVDFNVSPCMWEVGQRIGDEWRFFDEIVSEQCNIVAMTEEFRQRYPSHGAELIIHGDQTGQLRHVQSGRSTYSLMQEALQGYPVPIRLQLPKRNPLVVDRLIAVNRALSGVDGRVRLIFGPACVEAIADCEETLRDPKGGIKKIHHTENPYWRRTHAMDAVGYAVHYVDPAPQVVIARDNTRGRLRIPTPGYLSRGGPRSLAAYPRSYDANGRLRRGPAGAVLPPRHT